MKRYSFDLSFVVEFATFVRDHRFLLRILPREDGYQQVEDLSFEVQGCSPIPLRDCFGNAVLTGIIHEDHQVFTVKASGRVAQKRYRIIDSSPAVFRHSTGLTVWTSDMRDWAAEACGHTPFAADPMDGTFLDAATAISHRIHEDLEYRSGSTTTRTRAAQVFVSRQGVCQDFAHLGIALCRSLHIPARYAFGYVPGVGASHAWFEVFSAGAWYGLDPTADTPADAGYIKVGHGRDTFDCPMNRGSLSGLGNQKQTLSISVAAL